MQVDRDSSENQSIYSFLELQTFIWRKGWSHPVYKIIKNGSTIMYRTTRVTHNERESSAYFRMRVLLLQRANSGVLFVFRYWKFEDGCLVPEQVCFIVSKRRNRRFARRGPFRQHAGADSFFLRTRQLSPSLTVSNLITSGRMEKSNSSILGIRLISTHWI